MPLTEAQKRSKRERYYKNRDRSIYTSNLGVARTWIRKRATRADLIESKQRILNKAKELGITLSQDEYL